MAMQRNLWSINALATELGIDRRTVAKRLDGVPPAGEIRGKPAWLLSDALPALTGSQRPPPAPPPGAEALAGLSAAEALALALVAELVLAAPATIAALAIDTRMTDASAGPALQGTALGALAATARDVLDAAGLPGDRLASLLDLGRLAQARFDLFPGFDQAAADAKVAALMAA